MLYAGGYVELKRSCRIELDAKGGVVQLRMTLSVNPSIQAIEQPLYSMLSDFPSALYEVVTR